jgi:hypothetical protein
VPCDLVERLIDQGSFSKVEHKQEEALTLCSEAAGGIIVAPHRSYAGVDARLIRVNSGYDPDRHTVLRPME